MDLSELLNQYGPWGAIAAVIAWLVFGRRQATGAAPAAGILPDVSGLLKPNGLALAALALFLSRSEAGKQVVDWLSRLLRPAPLRHE